MKIEIENIEGVDYSFTIDKVFGRSLRSEDTDLDLVPYSDFIIAVLRADAKMTLPPSTPYEIRAAIPANFGRWKAYCWYYSPEFEKREDIPEDGKWRGSMSLGIMTAGRFLT